MLTLFAIIYPLGALFTGIRWGQDLLLLSHGPASERKTFDWYVVTIIGAILWPITFGLVYVPLIYLHLRYGQYGAF